MNPINHYAASIGDKTAQGRETVPERMHRAYSRGVKPEVVVGDER